MKLPDPARRAGVLLLVLAISACPSSDTPTDGDGTGGASDAGDAQLRRPDGGASGTSQATSSVDSRGSSRAPSSSAASGTACTNATSAAASVANTSAPHASSVGVSSTSTGSPSSSAVVPPSSSSPPSSSTAGGPSGLVFINSPDHLFTFHPVTHAVTDLGAFIFQDAGGQPLPSGQKMLDLALSASGSAFGITYDIDTPAADFFFVTLDTATRVARRVGNAAYYSSLCVVPAGMAFPEEALFAVDGAPFLDALRPESGAVRYSFSPWTAEVQSAGDLAAASGVGVYASVYQSAGGFHLAQVDTYDGSLNVLGPVGFPNVLGLAFSGGTLFGVTREGNILSINRQTGAGTVVATFAAEFIGAAAAP